MIKGLHHNAYRCRDSEETRRFYEDFLGLPLAGSLDIRETKSGGSRRCCTRSTSSTTARISRSSRRPTCRSSGKRSTTSTCTSRSKSRRRAPANARQGKGAGIETRGVSDHGFIHSIYFRDPNGYVIELTAKMPGHAGMMDPATNDARSILDRWQAEKARGQAGAD
jgi:catechol 2,3-dioxygenase-like lactoylglutathione lyase family enzyme